MHVVLDGAVFENDYQLGIQRYFHRLVGAMGDRVKVKVLLHARRCAPLPPGTRAHRFRGRSRLKGWGVVRDAFLALQTAVLFPGYGRSVFHSSYYREPPRPHAREVVTVYDMCIASRPELFGPQAPTSFAQKQERAIHRAKLLLCISRSTAAAVIARYPEVSAKVRVVCPGADHFSAGAATALLPAYLPTAFVLFLGSRARYKNFEVVLRALNSPAWPRTTALVVVGPALSRAEEALIRSLGLSDRVVVAGPIADALLPPYFQRASCFVFPSLCEGFGFPLLEAQSLGTPVACSRIPAFEEVASGTAEFFDPNNHDELAAAVSRACSPSSRDSLRNLGLRNVARFTWSECARRTLDVYQEAAGLDLA